MAQQAQQVAQDGSLIAIIGDEVRRRSTRARATNDGPAAVRTTTTRSHTLVLHPQQQLSLAPTGHGDGVPPRWRRAQGLPAEHELPHRRHE